jgi:hypothetical protein
VGIAVGVSLAAVGLFGVFSGNIEKWKGIRKYYAASFSKDNQPSPENNTADHFLKRFTARPRVQKFLNNRWAKGANKSALVAMTVEAGVFTLLASSAVIVSHIAAMAAAPQAIAAGMIPLAIAVNWARGSAWHLISASRLLVRNFFHIASKVAGAKKKAAAPVSAPQPVPAPIATPAAVNGGLSAKPLSGVFDKAANKEPDKAVPQVSAPVEAKLKSNPPLKFL